MKPPLRIVLFILVATVAVALLFGQKAAREKAALLELKNDYGAEIGTIADDIIVTISGTIYDKDGNEIPNPASKIQNLKDLRKVSRLIKRAGNAIRKEAGGGGRIEAESGVVKSVNVRATGLALMFLPGLESLAGIENLGDLTVLTAFNCPKLKDTRGIGTLENLRDIGIVDCAALTEIDEIASIRSLENLDLSGSSSLQSVPNLSGLPDLNLLYLSRCTGLKALDVSGCAKLSQIHVENCIALQRIDGLAETTNLKDLEASGCHSLEHLDGLEKLAALQLLSVKNVDAIDLETIGKLQNLVSLRIAGNSNLTTLAPFAALKKLREIHIDTCENLASLQGMPPGVTQFAGFRYCPKLTTLDGLEAAAGLGDLDVGGCESLSDISAVAKLPELLQVSFFQCPLVTDVSGLENLEKVDFVRLGGTGVPEAGIGDLQKKMPDTIFDFSGGNN
ncbi:MAG: hypothetical protein HKN23_11695 [Verrucomicrobiales bacterium]|nr:hypothetical protein [Verrucomicrobiales bacterium]